MPDAVKGKSPLISGVSMSSVAIPVRAFSSSDPSSSARPPARFKSSSATQTGGPTLKQREIDSNILIILFVLNQPHKSVVYLASSYREMVAQDVDVAHRPANPNDTNNIW